MALVNLRVLINELVIKYLDIFPKTVPIIILYSKSGVCMVKSGKYTEITRHIDRRIRLVRNDDNGKTQRIVWRQRGLQLIDIATKNVGDNGLNTIMTHTMVRLEN